MPLSSRIKARLDLIGRHCARTINLASTGRFLQRFRSGVHLCRFDRFSLVLDLSNPVHRTIHYTGTFEPEVTRALRQLLGENEVFVDVGANIGWHAVSTLAHRTDVRACYAFEPSSRVADFLRRSIEANKLAERCHLRQMALGDKKGRATLKTFVGLDPMHASLYALADYRWRDEEVPVDTLDSQVSTFEVPPSVVKCDVEGSELDVLRGSTEVLGGRFGPPPIWFLEANYETSGMAGFFPWQLLELAAGHAAYQGYFIRDGRIERLPSPRALRHGDTLILAIPGLHDQRLRRVRIRPASR